MATSSVYQLRCEKEPVLLQSCLCSLPQQSPFHNSQCKTHTWHGFSAFCLRSPCGGRSNGAQWQEYERLESSSLNHCHKESKSGSVHVTTKQEDTKATDSLTRALVVSWYWSKLGSVVNSTYTNIERIVACPESHFIQSRSRMAGGFLPNIYGNLRWTSTTFDTYETCLT